MHTILPTQTMTAIDLRPGDILLSIPAMRPDGSGRAIMDECRRRVRHVSEIGDGLVAYIDFASTACRTDCETAPRSCPHYGRGGRMDLPIDPATEVVVLHRSHP